MKNTIQTKAQFKNREALTANKRMHAFLLSLIGLGSSKCLFCGNVSYSYMTGVRARLDYIYFDGKDSCTCRLTSAIEVTKGFPSFTKAYRLSYPALDGVLQG